MWDLLFSSISGWLLRASDSQTRPQTDSMPTRVADPSPLVAKERGAVGFWVGPLNSLFVDVKLKQSATCYPRYHLSPKRRLFWGVGGKGVFSPSLVLIKCFVCMISLVLAIILPDEHCFSCPILQMRKLRSREVKSQA